FKTGNLERIEVSSQNILPHFNITRNNDSVEVECFIKPEAIGYGLDENEVKSPLVFLYNHQLYLWQNAEAVETVEGFLPGGILKITNEDWPQKLSKLVMPLTRDYKVDFDRSMISEVKDGEPEVKLFLHEKGEYLVF